MIRMRGSAGGQRREKVTRCAENERGRGGPVRVQGRIGAYIIHHLPVKSCRCA